MLAKDAGLIIPVCAAKGAVDKKDFIMVVGDIDTVIDTRYEKLSEQILEQAVETYERYLEAELEHGHITEEELEKYPEVDDEEGIWELLTPFRVEVFKRGWQDFWIGYDFAWWNPHGLLAYVKGEELLELQADG